VHVRMRAPEHAVRASVLGRRARAVAVQSVTATVPATASQPSAAYRSCRASQSGGTSESASVVASQLLAAVPAGRSSGVCRRTSRTPAARARPTFRALSATTVAPASWASAAVPSEQASAATTIRTRSPGCCTPA
jgi:hypothetical protein